MPLLKQWTIKTHSRGVIWKMDEPESFFVEHTGITTDIKNDKRRLEHIAGRFLLKYIESDFPLADIYVDGHGKPRLKNSKYLFSISHSYPYVAAVVSPYQEAGIDIQVPTPQIQKIKHKFLSASEDLFTLDDDLLTMAWTSKEAVYKWFGRKGIDFIQHMPIVTAHPNGTKFSMDISLKPLEEPYIVCIEGIKNKHFFCAYVVGRR